MYHGHDLRISEEYSEFCVYSTTYFHTLQKCKSHYLCLQEFGVVRIRSVSKPLLLMYETEPTK